MSTSTLYPNISPSLNLDFSNSEVLDPRITFTRASTATYYDGVTTAKAEENLLLQSQDFTNAVWTKQAASATENTEVAPDGTTTAETITLPVGGGSHAVLQSYPALTGGRVASIFAKSGTHDYIQLSFNGDATPFANFDLDTGVVGTTGSNQTASIVSVGNGWYRCIMYTSSTTATNFYLQVVDSSSSARQQNWTALGTETVYLWGAQLEQRDAVTSYTATTTQQITNYIPVLLSATNNVPRFDHNPTTGESLGLLIEEQRTNLFTYSADFANAAWSKFRASITSNIIVAPDGTLTGDKLVEDTTATNTHYVSDSVNLIANTSYNATVYVKAAERTRVRLQNSSTPNWTTVGSAYFDLSAGTIVSGTGSITPIGNGWYRCSINGTFGGADAAGGLNIFIVESGTTISYTGDGYSGIYIWGAQLEAAEFPTSYIATGAATATRIADSASMTGTNFSSWYNQGEGTLYAEATTRIPYTGTNLFPRICEINDAGSTNNAIRMTYGVLSTETDFRSAVVVNGVSQYTSESGESNGGKQIIAYKTDDFSSASNGTLLSVDTSGTVPVVNTLFLGGYTTSNFDGNINGHIRKLSYYPLRLTNAQLQALTT
jgi:hypothetical protein